MIGTALGTIDDHYFRQHWPWIYSAAILFALLPDLDIVLKVVDAKIRGNSRGHHRTILHQPFYFGIALTVWFALALLLRWPLIWPLTFAAGSLLHFGKDSLGEYDQQGKEFNIGISWLSPFRRETFVLFGMMGKEKRFLVTKPVGFVGMEHKQWLRTLYLRMNQRLLKEIGWFMLWLLIAAVRVASVELR